MSQDYEIQSRHDPIRHKMISGRKVKEAPKQNGNLIEKYQVNNVVIETIFQLTDQSTFGSAQAHFI